VGGRGLVASELVGGVGFAEDRLHWVRIVVVYDTRVQIFDVSVPIRPGMRLWLGDPEVRLELVSAIARGEGANVTRLEMSAHAGTHVDAPAHFLEGAAGVDALPLDALVGPCIVVDATASDRELGPEVLPAGAERVLLKTRDAVLSDEAAEEVVRRGIRLVGIDSLSIGGDEAHRTLLRAGIVPLESLDLGRVEPGSYRLVCLPLKLVGADGAPARVILIRD
jgi:arylformamidase